MIALTNRFAILATFCSLAAISLHPSSVDAAVIQARYSDSLSPVDPTHTPSSLFKKAVRQKSPVLALPEDATKKAGNAKAKAKSPSNDKKDDSKKSHKAVRSLQFYSFFNDFLCINP
jgi:hypothetical protein